MNHKHPSTFFTGVVIGAVAGAVAGLLLAPQSGHETRKQLKQNAQKARVRANLLVKEGEDLAEDAKEKMHEVKEKVHHAKHTVKEHLDS